MPPRAFKKCRTCGCNELVLPPVRYCNNHKIDKKEIEENRDRKDYFKNYNKMRDDEKHQMFYRSKAWKNLRLSKLSKDAFICRECLKANKIKGASVVHHIIPIKDDWGKRLDFNNLISLCDGCHQRIHRELDFKKDLNNNLYD